MRSRPGVLVTTILAFGVTVAGPATASAAPGSCTWTLEEVTSPVGYDERYTRVQGTDSRGNYSGTVLASSSNSSEVVLWTGGQPRVAHEVADFVFPRVSGENSAGDVLLSGHQRSTGRHGAFLLSGGHTGHGTLTYLPPPEGYETDYAVALNERGDVLGQGHAVKDGHPVSLFWSTLASGPIVIDTPLGQGIDLDDDGTVLIHDSAGNPAHLWRGGVTTPLEGSRYPLLFSAIRGGKVIGTRIDTWPQSQSLLWSDPTSPLPIDDGGTAQAINARGLIVGSRGALTGPPAVWRGTTLLADLPLPDGVADDSDVYVIGDDDTIFGRVSGQGPLKWTCVRTDS